MSERTVRAFVAVELDDSIRRGLFRIQSDLQRHLEKRAIRWVRPEGIHLTLNFLGDVPAGRLDSIGEVLAPACRGLAPFEVHPERLGCFPDFKRPRVIWVGLGGDVASLLALQKATTGALDSVGFSPEGRSYSPHLTLGRVRREVRGREKSTIGPHIQEIEVPALGAIGVESVILMRSDLSPRGASYLRLGSFPLEGDRH